jgi:hypothetical protein
MFASFFFVANRPNAIRLRTLPIVQTLGPPVIAGKVNSSAAFRVSIGDGGD